MNFSRKQALFSQRAVGSQQECTNEIHRHKTEDGTIKGKFAFPIHQDTIILIFQLLSS